LPSKRAMSISRVVPVAHASARYDPAMHPIAELDHAVRNLTGRYCDAVTRFDLDLFGRCWTADAAWVVPNVITTVGRDDIVELFGSLRTGFTLCVQELLSGVIEPVDDGSAAEARWQIRELQWAADRPARCLLGTYTDRIVLEDGSWRFARRQFDELYRGPTDLSGRVRPPART
jgi:hypothetical protein